MSRLTFTLVWTVLATGLLTFMLVAWRARKKRDAGLEQPALGLEGETIEHFAKVGYVSTTPVGDPLERIAIPGLSFRGWAELIVFADGVAIEVTGESRVEIPKSRIVSTARTSGRIGKFVEADGLSLLIWQTEATDSIASREFESGFRFNTPALQRRFEEAVAQIAQADPAHSNTDLLESTDLTTSQEDS